MSHKLQVQFDDEMWERIDKLSKRLHWSKEVITCERVFQNQLTFTGSEFNGYTRVLGDLLASAHGFASVPPANGPALGCAAPR